MIDSPTHDPISESHLVCGQHPLGKLKIFRVFQISKEYNNTKTTKGEGIENKNNGIVYYS